jgi:cell division septum initiation protein DivIVA
MSTEEPKAALAAENARLKARIDELEAELQSKGSGKKSKSHTETDKLVHDMPDKAADEATRLLHALAHAFVEQLRSSADVIKVVADEAFKRREQRSSKDERLDEMRLSEIEDDLASVLNKGIDKSLDVPRRVVDKFYEVYQEPTHKSA